MSPSKILGIAAALSLAAIAVVELSADKALTRGEIAVSYDFESKVTFLPDGGKAYRVPVRLKDGGTDYDVKTAAEAPCKRRRPKADCRFADGGLAPDLNRYPSSMLSGVGCEPVACSVWLGENADEDEQETRTRK